MNGIKMSDCKFYVNEVKKTIVCVIPNTKDLLMDFIHENFQFMDMNLYDAINFWDGKYQKSIRMPNTFIGKAKCMAGDTWDEELGKMIAFSKAKDKCYKSFFKRANLFVQTLDRRLGDIIEMFNTFGHKLDDKKKGLQQMIDEKLSKNE